MVGTFPLIAAEELAKLTSRPVVQVRKRLRQFLAAGYLDRIQGTNESLTYFEEVECEQCKHVNRIAKLGGRTIATPWFWYLTPKGETEAVKYTLPVVAWKEKSKNIVDHDRGLTLIHLALHSKFDLFHWLQKREDMRQTAEVDGQSVGFYPDARFNIEGINYFLEYQHSTPSSRNGETDLDVKVKRYNALLKNRKDAKVIFVFTEQNHVRNFLNRIEKDYPYRWLWTTDMESVKHNPGGAIFWCPKDYDVHTYSFSEASP